MDLNFIPNSDGKTCSMLIDGIVTNNEIPYVPEKCVDHRGLYYYLIEEENIELNKNIPNINEVIRGYKYMKNPIFVKQAIQNFKNRI